MAPDVTLDERDIATYERDGVVKLSGLFGPAWLERLAVAVDEAIARPGPHGERYTAAGRPGGFFGDLDLWTRHAAFRDFVMGSAAAAIAGRAMRATRVNFFYDQLLVKEPGTEERTPWHQDQPYWAVAGRQVCSVWLTLDPVARGNGVEFVRGSHRWEREYLPRHFKDGTPYDRPGLAPLPDIEAARDDYAIAAFDMAPGDCLVFQAMIVHGARGNASTRHRRRALSTRWIGDDARYRVRDGETAIPTSDPGLRDGAPMDCALFPRVWERPQGT